jgi:alpha-glucosidase
LLDLQYFSIKFSSNTEFTSYKIKDVVSTLNSLQGKLYLPHDHTDIIPEFGADINELSLTVEYQSPYRIRICISDVEKKRWRIPDSIVPLDKARPDVKEFDYDFGYENNPFGFYVNRKRDGERIFDTTSQMFIFKDQYIEMSTKLPQKSNIYGLGEVVSPLKREKGKRMTLWTRGILRILSFLRIFFLSIGITLINSPRYFIFVVGSRLTR